MDPEDELMLENGWYATIDRKIAQDEPKRITYCEDCGEWIYEGDEALRLPGGGWMCSECVSKNLHEMTEDDEE